MGEEPENKFEVRDKRRFSPETGELRQETEKDEKPEEKTEKSASAPESVKKEAQQHATTDAAKTDPAVGPMPEANLSGMILGLATQALTLLGEISETPGAPPKKDLPSAKHVIDTLGVLQEKTKGNLDETEEKLLEHTLHDLRMRYVDATKTK